MYLLMKYVFIGGGNNGHTRSDGVKTPYETPLIDKYIVKLSNKENPNLLFIVYICEILSNGWCNYLFIIIKIFISIFV